MKKENYLGCVIAELLIGKPIFQGETAVDQIVEIIKILGTPTIEQVKLMNPNYKELKFPQIKPYPWLKVKGIKFRLFFVFGQQIYFYFLKGL